MPVPKIELLIPSWPAQRADAQYGATNYGAYSGVDTTKMYFRARDMNSTYVSDDCRAYQDICLYIWFDNDNTVCLDLRLCDIHTMQLYDAEKRIKLLKKMIAKANKSGVIMDNFYRNVDDLGIYDMLKKVVSALGIKRTIQYHGIGTPDTYAPVDDVVSYIAKDVIARRNKMV